jgi:hypothetical protein
VLNIVLCVKHCTMCYYKWIFLYICKSTQQVLSSLTWMNEKHDSEQSAFSNWRYKYILTVGVISTTKSFFRLFCFSNWIRKWFSHFPKLIFLPDLLQITIRYIIQFPHILLETHFSVLIFCINVFSALLYCLCMFQVLMVN